MVEARLIGADRLGDGKNPDVERVGACGLLRRVFLLLYVLFGLDGQVGLFVWFDPGYHLTAPSIIRP